MNIKVGISCKWTNDSQRFLLEHLDSIHESPSQIYHSALPFCPPTTWLQEYYSPRISQDVQVVKGLPAKWSVCSHTASLGIKIYEISYSNNSVAVGSWDRDIIILNAITGSQTAILSGHTDRVLSVAFSSDGRSLASGSGDMTIKLWDMQTGGAIETFSGHTGAVRSVSISVDCTTIASGSFDKTVRLWNTQTGECLYIIEQQYEVYSVKFSPTDPQFFLFMSDRKIWQWNTSGHQVGSAFNGFYVNFSPDGTQIVSRHKDATTVWNSSTRAIVMRVPVVIDEGQRCCFSPDGRLIAVSVGRIAHIWDITGSEPHLIETFIGYTDDVSSLAFSSSFLILASVDGSVKFWKTGAQPTDLVGTNPKSISLKPVTIMSITLQTKDNIFITSDSDGVVRTYGIFTRLCEASFQTPAKGYDKRDIQLVNSQLVLAWHTGGKIKIWDVEKEKLLLTADGASGLEDIKILEDGSRFLSIGARVIQAQSMKTGKIVSKAGIKFINNDRASLTLNGSRLWVHYLNAETQVWDFGTPSSSPVQLPNMPLHILHPTGLMLWDISPSCVKEKATGKVVFWLCKSYGKPVNVQWNDQYLLASFISGEVLVLDFSHLLPL